MFGTFGGFWCDGNCVGMPRSPMMPGQDAMLGMPYGGGLGVVWAVEVVWEEVEVAWEEVEGREAII